MPNDPVDSNDTEKNCDENTSLKVSNHHSKKNLYQNVKRTPWPLIGYYPEPILMSNNEEVNPKKHISIYLPEGVRVSLEKHLTVVKVSRQEWIRHAILLLLEKEQLILTNKSANKANS
jgi:hypothetical protein